MPVVSAAPSVIGFGTAEDRYAQILAAAPVGIGTIDCTGRYVTVNDRFCSIIGYSREELVGRLARQFTFAEDLRIATADLDTILRGDRPTVRSERRYVRKDGRVLWMSVTLQAVTDAEGHLESIVNFVEDITEQRENRERLALQSRMLDCVRQGVIATDINGSVIYWNRFAEELYGWTSEEALGRNVLELITAADSTDRTADIFERLQSGGTWSGELELRRRDGSTFTGSVTDSHLIDIDGRFTGVVGVSTDITAQKKERDELRIRREQLAYAQDIAAIGSWSHDYVTRRELVGSELCHLYGVEAGAEVSLDSLAEPIHPEDRTRIREARKRAVGALVPFSDEYRVVLPDGTERLMHERCRFVLDERGSVLKTIGVVQDVTGRKAAEEELRRRAVQQASVANLGNLALSDAPDQMLFAQAAQSLCEVLGVELSEVLQKQASTFRFVGASGWSDDLTGIEHPIRRRGSHINVTVESGVPVLVTDARQESRFLPSELHVHHDVLSSASVPIRSAGGQIWGVLSALSRQTRTYTVSEVDYLRSVAGILAQAIDRRRAAEEIAVRARQQSAIAELGRRMLKPLDRTTFLRACELVTEGLGIEHSLIYELVEEGTRIRYVAGRHWTNTLASEGPVNEKSHAGMTILANEPIVVDDYRTEERFDIRAVTSEYGILSGATVPIASATSTFGVLTAHSRPLRRFTESDVRFLQTVADILAEAVERESGRQALVTTTRNLQLLLESTLEGICTIDSEGQCTMINRAAARLLGYEPEELVGMPVFDVVQPDGDAEQAVQQVFGTGQELGLASTVLTRKDGSLVPIEYSAAAIEDDGVRVGVVVTFTDVSERRKLEAKLEQVSRLSSLGRLSSVMAHEFKNVLAGISPFVEGLRMKATPENIALSVEHIGRSVKRGRRITEDILRFAQPATPVRTRVEVESWLRGIATEGSSLLPPNIRVDVTSADGLPAMDVDPKQMQQIFTNLLLNARDAMPGGGTITLAALKHEPGDRFAFGAVGHPERFVHLAVTDTGSGMTPEVLRRIFEPLFTTKSNGTGLGLPVAHQVVQQHGGELFVETALGQGTTFHLFLPTAQEVVIAGDAEISAPVYAGLANAKPLLGIR
jgi:PAS domain S-box-containing protein